MKHLLWSLIFFLTPAYFLSIKAQEQTKNYPQAQISNENVIMKLYLPDQANGYYRATRFDWSGIIYSLEYDGHQYFGEWKSTHDPFFHEDLTGPVEAFRYGGMGYDEAKPGESFMRIGVGMLKKENDGPFVWRHTYQIVDFGEWEIDKGNDWIEFRHTLKSKVGWAYIYTKKIVLLKEKPGFAIQHTLKNTGKKTIQTDQFNHNFFVIDKGIAGPDFKVKVPFSITSVEGLNGQKEAVEIGDRQITFTKEIIDGFVWMELKGYSSEVVDHQFRLINEKTGAGVQVNVDRPLNKLAFWATTTTLCPENFVDLNIEPGKSENWTSEYILFSK